MAYIGVQPAEAYTSFAVQHFTTSATTSYTLDNPVANENEIALFINNVRQQPGSSYAYTASGTTLTLSAATSASDTMYCVFIGKAVQTVTPANGSVTNDMLSSGSFSNITGTGTLTNFTSTGIDDNATSTALTIASDGRNTVDSTNEKPLVIHHSDGSNCRIGFQNNTSNAHYIGVDSSDIVFSPAGLSSRIKIADMGIRAGNLDETLGLGSSTRGIACSGNGYASLRVRRGSDDGTCVQFYGHSSSSSFVGSITVTGSSTAYNTSSDYRLKENVVDLADATTRVKQLKPKRFNFTIDADTTVDGFLAHEVSSVVPEAISGTHNEVEVWKEGEELPEGVSVGDNKLDDEGNTIPKYQGIDQSKLVPLLTASLKEAIAKIEELETRIATLENA